MPVTFQPSIRIRASSEELICADQQCQASVNPVAKQLHQIAKDVYGFFLTRFGINGVDGKGEIPPFIIGWDKDNAAWTCSANGGSERCVLKFHNSRALQNEVVAHEYTHGILSRHTKLGYFGEAGALHESISDVMAIAFKHMMTNVKNWKIGTDRDLSVHFDMSVFQIPFPNSSDHGHVHHNSQIPSHAFYEMVQQVGDQSYGIIASIWMNAALMVVSRETFREFAYKTIEQAHSFNVPSVTRTVLQAWVHVQVLTVQIRKSPVETDRRARPQALRFMSERS